MVNHFKSAAVLLAICSSSFLVLLYGLRGTAGNSLITGGIFLLPLCIILAATFFEGDGNSLNFLDFVFVCFLAGSSASFVVSPPVAGSKGIILFVVCALAAFLAGRCIHKDNIKTLLDWCFWLCGGLLLIGTALTIGPLIRAWADWRPDILGFPYAATEFSMVLAYFSIAYICRQKKMLCVESFFAICLISVSAFVYAASLVRFTLVAGVAVIAVMFLIAPRKKTLIVLTVFVISIGAGVISRSTQSAILVDYAATVLSGRTAPRLATFGSGDTAPVYAVPPAKTLDTTPVYVVPPSNITSDRSNMPSCTGLVNLKNSISLRKALFLDAVALLPTAGVFGHGLGSFQTKGCLPGFEVHNIFLQAFVELGWFAGTALALLALIPGFYLLFGAVHDDNIRFVLSIFAVTAMVAMCHGALNQDLPAFLLIGVASGVSASMRPARSVAVPSAIAAE